MWGSGSDDRSWYAGRCGGRYRYADMCDQPVENSGQPSKVVDEEIVCVWMGDDGLQNRVVDLQKQH